MWAVTMMNIKLKTRFGIVLIFTILMCELANAQKSKLPWCVDGEKKDSCYGKLNIFGYRYEGEYKDGQPDGYGTYTFPNGDVYVGEFKDNKFEGRGTYTYADNGEKKIGIWKNNKLLGEKE